MRRSTIRAGIASMNATLGLSHHAITHSPGQTNMNLLNTDKLLYRIGRKTKGLRAKPMVTLLVDRTVMAKFLVDTLEAKEPVHADAMFCIGESNDAWQQSAKKLLAKYTVDAIDPDGWMVCNPRQENSVEFCEITTDTLDRLDWTGDTNSGYIQGLWGESVYQLGNNLQRFNPGDFVLRSREDPSDVWVVNRKIFLNSYSEITG